MDAMYRRLHSVEEAVNADRRQCVIIRVCRVEREQCALRRKQDNLGSSRVGILYRNEESAKIVLWTCEIAIGSIYVRAYPRCVRVPDLRMVASSLSV